MVTFFVGLRDMILNYLSLLRVSSFFFFFSWRLFWLVFLYEVNPVFRNWTGKCSSEIGSHLISRHYAILIFGHFDPSFLFFSLESGLLLFMMNYWFYCRGRAHRGKNCWNSCLSFPFSFGRNHVQVIKLNPYANFRSS